ncbi:MAG TPA: cysteine hydrolase [Propionicimonas sp.]|uniref:cysteine hydrolase family protein n=1 Tax=Propionicimonas sp. TaxID=1955623 RepID=UPI002F42D090
MPAATLLAAIDMQNVFAAADSPWRTPRFPDVIAPIRQLATAFGADTVFTRFVAPAEPSGSWRPYYAQWTFALQPADAPLWNVVDELADLAVRTVSAPTFSKWRQLSAELAPGGRLVLCGVSTDCCVLSTALEAADAGAEVLVVEDACAGLDDNTHAKALEIMDLYAPLVRVVDLAEALAVAPGS